MRLVDKIILVHPNTEWTLDGDEYANLVFLDGTIKLDEETFNEIANVKIAEAETARLAAEEQARLDAETKAATKAAALARLGLTEEEINAFLS